MTKFTLVKNYIKLDTRIMDSLKLPVITVHGRFQPPLHVNHYATYIKNAFKLADHVVVLIANPYCNEEKRSKARWRSQKINNPFTYEERVEIFQSFFNEMKIDTSRYSFKPFEITNEESWTNILNKNVPNLINTYSDWSWSKLNKFKKLGYKVIHSDILKIKDISGWQIREIIFSNMGLEKKKKELINVGYMKEAIPGLFTVLKKRS